MRRFGSQARFRPFRFLFHSLCFSLRKWQDTSRLTIRATGSNFILHWPMQKPYRIRVCKFHSTCCGPPIVGRLWFNPPFRSRSKPAFESLVLERVRRNSGHSGQGGVAEIHLSSELRSCVLEREISFRALVHQGSLKFLHIAVDKFLPPPSNSLCLGSFRGLATCRGKCDSQF